MVTSCGGVEGDGQDKESVKKECCQAPIESTTTHTKTLWVNCEMGWTGTIGDGEDIMC